MIIIRVGPLPSFLRGRSIDFFLNSQLYFVKSYIPVVKEITNLIILHSAQTFKPKSKNFHHYILSGFRTSTLYIKRCIHLISFIISHAMLMLDKKKNYKLSYNSFSRVDVQITILSDILQEVQ